MSYQQKEKQQGAKETFSKLQLVWSIPTIVNVGSQRLMLRGVIVFDCRSTILRDENISANKTSCGPVGHFRAFSGRKNGIWEEYDDQAMRPRECHANRRVNVEVMLYTK
jgi:formate-dependent phosphoribosylglycinamide formyltransferase (GAR transformylase)